MGIHQFLIASFFCGLLAQSSLAIPGVSEIVSTGVDVPGLAGAKFFTLEPGPANDDGKLVFQATLENGLGGVTVTNDLGVWQFDGISLTLVAREGSSNVPDISGANFQAFSDVAIDVTGDVTLRASLENGTGGVTADSDQGVWHFSSGVGQLVARTGAGGVPGIPSADFAVIRSTLQMASNGRWVDNSDLAPGVGGVTVNDSKGLWSYENGTNTLLAREAFSSVPGIAPAQFDVFGTPRVNTNDQITYVASLKSTAGITGSNKTGVWQYTGTSGELIARTGVGGVPGVAGSDFTSFETPTQNSLGQIAMKASLDASSDQGVWVYTNGVGALLARSSVGSVPNVAGANFESFHAPLLNDAGNVLAKADLEIGPGGVAMGNETGLWFLDGAGSLVARTGSAGVPEIPEANFLELSTYSLNSQGQVALAATLETGVGGIDSSNDSGLWVFDALGDSTLIAQKGDMLSGRSIATLDFWGNSGGGDSQANGWNNAGQLVFQATFANGDSGLFLYSPLSADFDADGDVDSDDLAGWEPAFGTNGNADADNDNDSDGMDFLIWQRQRGKGVPAPVVVAVVPEPDSVVLLIIAGVMVCQCLRNQRYKRYDRG